MPRWCCGMSDPVALFASACRASNPAAAAANFPPFTTGLRTETPLNSAPYLLDLEEFDSLFATTADRIAILADLHSALNRLEAAGVVWRMLLVGGSFIRRAARPSDLDAMVLYAIDPAQGAAAREVLRGWSAAQRGMKVDLSFCPVDVDPMILVKRAIFFSNVFSYDRASDCMIHGTVMVLPSTPSRVRESDA